MLQKIHPVPFVIHPPDDLVENDPGLEKMSLRLGDQYANGHATDGFLRIMGSMLWKALKIQSAFDEASSAAGSDTLPVVIESNVAGVQALPWETLFHPRLGFLGSHKDFTLTRCIPLAANNQQTHLEKGPLRVLLFTSLPDDVNPDTGRLNIEEEQSQVQEALLPWIASGLVQLEMPDDGRFSTLKELLKNFRPHLLFLSGHGHFYHAPHAGEAYGVFLFESETGETEAVKEDQIADALSGTGVRAVVLSACESGKAASDALSNGLMRRIATAGIPHVIGMRESILDEAGIHFTRLLCDSLAGQDNIEFALQSARRGILEIDKHGQWCLPVLVSSQPNMPLIDWDFQPHEIDGTNFSRNTFGKVSLPARFIGRRAEMRRHKSRLAKGELHSLLITGPGGQGKTALAGKLAMDMQTRGWQVFAWSANGSSSWRAFELDMEQALDKPRVDRYNQFLLPARDEKQRANSMLALLIEQFSEHVILFLDNLESIQDPKTGLLSDPLIAAWISAACELYGLVLIVTSRLRIPGWNGEQLALDHASYGDFLQLAQLRLPRSMLKRRELLRRVYEVLAGNCRGLEFFAAALSSKENGTAGQDFLDALEQSRLDLQTNMAIEEIYNCLSPDAQRFLQRLPAYHEPVPREGLLRLGSRLLDVEAFVDRLLAVSLLDASEDPHHELTLYLCNPLVVAWLKDQNLIDHDPAWSIAAGDYHRYLLTQEWQLLRHLLAANQTLQRHAGADQLAHDLRIQQSRTLDRALAAYHALERAGRSSDAYQVALDYIVGPLTLAGSYKVLLDEFLPNICQSEDAETRGRALMHTGSLLQSMGNYRDALSSHKEALAAMQQADDQAGVAVILNKIAMICRVLGDYNAALENLQKALLVQQRIQDIQGLATTLSNFAQIHQDRGNYVSALKELEQVLDMQRKAGDRAGESTTLNNMATVFQTQGENDSALSCLNQAYGIQEQIGDRAGEAAMLNNISGVYQRQGEFTIALKYLKQALTIEQEIGDKAGEAITLNNISGIYRRQAEYDTAFNYLNKALAIQQQIGHKAGEATTLNNIGSVLQMQGEYRAAMEYFEQALNIRKGLADRAGVAQLLNNIATIHQAQGRYSNALKNLEQVLALAREIGNKAFEGGTLNNMATAYQAQGNYRAAFNCLQQSLEITRETGNRMAEAVVLHNLAELYQSQGDMDTALSIYRQALAIRRKIGDLSGEAQTLGNLSQIYRLQGNLDEAMVCLEDARAIQHQIKNRPAECITLINLGHMHRQTGRIQDALAAWGSAYLLAKQINLRQILDDLPRLALLVGLPESLDSWEKWAQDRTKQE